ncbi:uncharacterized protein ARMOST_20951 [Armillaria ostoyae]|uniref:F-box domain-containing protein n=1 Tax=Armillaria ostoyae TaxID=47428 RepID=A0A284S8R5_ARMOS|nr:uncharacterized protein ARMOST_20951 [Armillaria ostoyae]
MSRLPITACRSELAYTWHLGCRLPFIHDALNIHRCKGRLTNSQMESSTQSSEDREWRLISKVPIKVVFLVLQDTDPVSMVRFGMVCFGAHEIVVDFMTRSYTVCKLFADFMPSSLIPEFQSVQRETGAIVSGSTSLGFFLRTRFLNSDFDVFVNYC